MLNEIKFLKPAIEKKPFRPIYEHIRIENGCAVATNGKITMSVCVDCDFTKTPRADELVAALKGAGEVHQISVLNNKMVVKSGKFRANVRCTTEVFPTSPTGGKSIELPPLLDALKAVRKFSQKNCNYAWARTVLIKGQSMFATTGATMIEYWLGSAIPGEFAIPLDAVDAMISIGIEPNYVEVSESWVRFHYGTSWLHRALIEEKWPNNIEQHFESDWSKGFQAIPDKLYAHLDSIRPFVKDDLWMRIENGSLLSSLETEADASVEIPEIDKSLHLSFNWEHLASIEDVAEQISFASPIRFIGCNLRGSVYAKSF